MSLLSASLAVILLRRSLTSSGAALKSQIFSMMSLPWCVTLVWQTREQVLFGYHKELFNEPKNYLVLVLNDLFGFQNLKIGVLSIVGFKNHLKSVLREWKVLYNLQNKNNNFDVFNDLFSILWDWSRSWPSPAQSLQQCESDSSPAQPSPNHGTPQV